MRIPSRRSRAQVGIGALLIFISMVLVSAVVAGVVMKTSYLVESKATMTGSDTQEEVVTAIRVTEVVGYSRDLRSISAVGLSVSLAPGSGNIRFDDILLAYHQEDIYVSGILHDLAPGAGVNNFSVTFIRNKTDDHVLERGELAQLWLDLEANPTMRPLAPGKGFTITVLPIGGQSVEITKFVPRGINQRYIIEW
jgi:flagellin FlaB